MEKLLVIVVDNAQRAYETSHALKELDQEGSISIYAEAVIQKNADGTITTKESVPDFPFRTVTGTVVGAMVGLLGGPAGVAIGAMAGTLAGGYRDLYLVEVGADFVDDVAATLQPGKSAVIADISEEWVTPVDIRMEALGAKVLRSPKKSVEAEQRAREIAALRAEIEQTKAELAQAHADRKAKLQAKIDRLNAKLDAKLEQAKKRSEQIKNETDAKVQALKKKAEKARGDVKTRLEAEVKEIRENYEASNAKMRHMLAEKLRGAAAKVEKKEEREPVHH